MTKINFVMILHSHQPVGNFEHIFEENYQKAYLPYLEVMKDYPDLKFVFHYSGCLYDWLLEQHPEYFDMLKKLVESGNAEMMGGGYQEPILSLLPEWDRNGQIKMMINFLKDKFGQDAAGYWLTERVWEQSLVKSLADAGVKYTAIDDSHFKAAGLSQEELFGYFTTEDEGRIISLFPGSEDLRYLIPFHPPEEVVEYIINHGDDSGKRIIFYADDGEKFGGWPGTHSLLYKENWLRRFFDLLIKNNDKINVITGEEAVSLIKPLGKLYIPDGSYREMTEWVLPAHRQEEYHRTVEKLKETEQWDEGSIFVKGGFWRNFRVKYSEANNLYARMMEVSSLLNDYKGNKIKFNKAKNYLYKAQCNCPHWHGVFGGLYLNFLRFGTYKNLIKAENIVRNSSGKVFIRPVDFDYDGRDEVIIENSKVKLYIKPDKGGSLAELDSLLHEVNLIDSMTRRREAYHAEIIERKDAEQVIDEGQSIHDLQRKISNEIVEGLVYDSYYKKSLIDHFYVDKISPAMLEKNMANEAGDFFNGEYESEVLSEDNSASVRLSKTGRISQNGKNTGVKILKNIKLIPDSSKFSVEYEIECVDGPEVNCNFGVEWNFSLLSGDSDDRYYYFDDRKKAGKLGFKLDKKGCSMVGLVDEWQNIDVNISCDNQIRVLTCPVKTVSQSEGGYDFSYQSSAVFTVKELLLKPGVKFNIKYIVDVAELQKS